MHKGAPRDLDPTMAPSVFDVDLLRVARVYAQALLKAARPTGKVDLMQEHFDALIGAAGAVGVDTKQSFQIGALLTSGAVPRRHKSGLIDRAFGGRADDLFVNFLQVLNDHNRLDIVRAVGAIYRELRDELHNRVRFQVRSAVPLTSEQKERIADRAREYFHQEPVLVEVVDPELLGGLQIQIGDRLFDMSLRTRLETIKDQLIERSSHEIQRRRDRDRT